jgi:hypothetical protein
MSNLPKRTQGARLHIMDARPKVAAVGNKFLGAGMENVGPGSRYGNCTLEYMNIGNIHAMRGSLQKLMEALEISDVKKQQQAIEGSHWRDHVGRILGSAAKIATILASGNPVLVHCTDGWDRTAQLTCLAELILDPHYRTLEGLANLIEKEWLTFGHKFAQRHGHGTFSPKVKDTQRAPIFLQFIDCLWQMSQQFPTSFEWNEHCLLLLVDACYSCVFGTFLCNTDQERRVLYHVADGTVSVWSYMLSRRAAFTNPLFERRTSTLHDWSDVRLMPKYGAAQLQVWRSLYCRYFWTSINELVGIPFNTPDLSVVTLSCMFRSWMQRKDLRGPVSSGGNNNNNNNNNATLPRSSGQGGVLGPPTVGVTPTNAPSLPSLGSAASNVGGGVAAVTAGENGLVMMDGRPHAGQLSVPNGATTIGPSAGARVANQQRRTGSFSITLDEIEDQRKSHLGKRAVPVLDRDSGSSLMLDVEEDEEEEDPDGLDSGSKSLIFFRSRLEDSSGLEEKSSPPSLAKSKTPPQVAFPPGSMERLRATGPKRRSTSTGVLPKRDSAPTTSTSLNSSATGVSMSGGSGHSVKTTDRYSVSAVEQRSSAGRSGTNYNSEEASSPRAVSPRSNAAKRRGVKLNANEITAVIDEEFAHKTGDEK